MNLLEFRQFFRNQSGRHDLVNSDGSDNGLDVIVNAAQKYLDRLADIPSGIGRVFKDISAGDFVVQFQDCRAILEVWSVGLDDNGDTVRLPLTKYSQEDLRGIDRKTLETNYVKVHSGLDQGRPIYYTPAQLRLVKDANGLTGGIGGMMDVVADGHQTYNGIVLMPPSDGSYSIEIVGRFYSATLSADTDSTRWTEISPLTLYAATMRQLEIIHRNSEGIAGWDRAIQPDIVGLDMDGVLEESIDATQMEG